MIFERFRLRIAPNRAYTRLARKRKQPYALAIVEMRMPPECGEVNSRRSLVPPRLDVAQLVDQPPG
jgi:hypothetical protein